MFWLARSLRRAGHRPESFGYLILTEDLDAIAARFAERVARVLAEDAEAGRTDRRYAVIGHSLGGVLARLAWPDLPSELTRLVMLAPPNRPPVSMVELGSRSPLRWVFRDAARKLRDPTFFDALPRPDTPTLVIAGDRGLGTRWLPVGGEPNDGIVRLSETILDGTPLVVVHGSHTFIMNRRDVFRAIRQFLEADEISGVGVPGAPSTSRHREC